MKNIRANHFLTFILSIILNFSLVNPALSGKNNHAAENLRDMSGSIFFEGKLRTYILHVPPGYNHESANKYPLVIVLHGGAGNAEKAMHMTDFNSKADIENFIAAYPNGVSKYKNLDMLLTWNAGNCCGYALDSDSNDTGFISALIDKLISKHNVDPKKVFVTGMSNGGMMSYRLGCELSHKIAAIAPVAGALNVACNPSEPVSIIAFHGTEDMHVLYNGGEPLKKADPHERYDNSVKYAIDFWIKNNGCDPNPQTIKGGSDGSVIIDSYGECMNGTNVKLYTIVGGGHAWPGGKKGSPRGDEPTQAISATYEIWEFFKTNPKK